MFSVQMQVGGQWEDVGAPCQERWEAEAWAGTLENVSHFTPCRWGVRIVEVDRQPTCADTVPADERIDLTTGEIS